MTGTDRRNRSKLPISLALMATIGLAACDENGEFAFPTFDDTGASSGDGVASAPIRTTLEEQDVERPDVFDVTDRGLWDGRPSLGGIWVAHPDVTTPERAIIRNPTNGQSVVGALFRRERENPGPALQVSSDAAEALGMVAGSPVNISVIALRTQEVEVPAEDGSTTENPVVAGLAAPVVVEAAPLDPVAGASAAIDAAEAVTPAIDVNLPPAPAIAVPAVPAASPIDSPAPAEQTVTAIDGPAIQIGVFTVEPNANAAAQTLRDAGIPTSVIAQEAGGRTVWRVVSGPATDAAERDKLLAQAKDIGFVDAFAIDS